MIRILQGSLASVEAKSLILMVNGIGYQVYCPSSLLAMAEGDMTLHIHSHIREDAFNLFGFTSKDELAFFEQLLSVNGVGPKMALCILDMPITTIQNAIVSEDVKTLSSVPGIGKKKAERIILELKNKIDPVAGGAESNDIHPDVFITLETLGYKRHHVQKILSEVEEEVTEVEEWIRVFLKRV
jgi:holliday junction DNA helicase RuvA